MHRLHRCVVRGNLQVLPMPSFQCSFVCAGARLLTKAFQACGLSRAEAKHRIWLFDSKVMPPRTSPGKGCGGHMQRFTRCGGMWRRAVGCPADWRQPTHTVAGILGIRVAIDLGGCCMPRSLYRPKHMECTVGRVSGRYRSLNHPIPASCMQDPNEAGKQKRGHAKPNVLLVHFKSPQVGGTACRGSCTREGASGR